MRRGFGYQQQSYGMRQEAQQQHQQSYSMHQEAAWHSKDDDYHNNHFSGVQIVPSLCLDSQLMKQHSMFDGSQAQLQFHGGSWGAQNMSQNGWCGTGSGAKKLMPLMGAMNGSQFSHGSMFNNALMENAEFEAGFHEVHVPASMRVQEMRCERSVWGDHDGLQYCSGFYDNSRWKRNGSWKSEWISKGA